jgi:SAM-dependent methyltransferase
MGAISPIKSGVEMPDGWQWDLTLFRGSAAYYDQGRLPYAPEFAERIAETLGLDGHGRLLDVGCGPGTVTLPLARYYAAVVGVDPDPDMLTQARRHAEQLGVDNVTWLQARAEDVSMRLGTFRTVTFAQSFHWTDRDRVASAVLHILEPGGSFVHISDRKGPPAQPAPLPHSAPPVKPIRALVTEYLGEGRHAGMGVLLKGTPDREDAVLSRAGFVDFQRIIVPAGDVVRRTADDIVAWVFSRSDSAPHLFGERLEEFERDLRKVLHSTAPDDVFAEQLPDTEVMLWRKASVP